jgi:hypothetical protein
VAHKVSRIVGIIRAPQAKILLGILVDSIIQVLYSRIIGIIGNIRSQDNIAEGTV